MSARKRPVRVVIEATEKRAFASAVDWPGWSRTARTDEAALQALAEHAERYAVVAAKAGIPFALGEYTVIERVPGTATTDFGAPDVPAAAEREPLNSADARRTVSLVEAAWAVLDRVARGAPPSLRKGPRGGGRDRDAILEHVLAAEHAYARKLGVKVPAPHRDQKKAIATLREAIVEVLRDARSADVLVEHPWLPRYAARRIAWHVIDHAWEIENRSEL
ncbi:MAG: hypothetical protein M3019_02765 [Candidatus Dormibacteraeota bacterium]|nr:hypothetical protein [Candidatus Dormibacteraeota bacterium]